MTVVVGVATIVLCFVENVLLFYEYCVRDHQSHACCSVYIAVH